MIPVITDQPLFTSISANFSKTSKVTLVGQSHLRNPQAAKNDFMLFS
jgi:hypothetical protein